MLERFPASAEPISHLFIRNLDRHHRSTRALDPRFWQDAAPTTGSATWWPEYLHKLRQVPQTPKARSRPLDEHQTSSLLRSPWLGAGRISGTDDSHNTRTQRSYTVSTSQRPVKESEYMDAFGMDSALEKLWKEEEESRPKDKQVDLLWADVQAQDPEQPAANVPFIDFRPTILLEENGPGGASNETGEGGDIVASFDASNSKRKRISWEKQLEKKQPPRWKLREVRARDVPIPDPRQDDDTVREPSSSWPLKIQSQLTKASLHRDELIRIFHAHEALTHTELDLIWQFFISAENQQENASFFLDTVSRDLDLYRHDPKGHDVHAENLEHVLSRRGLEIFRLIPEKERMQKHYAAAINFYLYVDEFNAATNLAMECATRGFIELPHLLAFYVQHQLWSHAAELMYHHSQEMNSGAESDVKEQDPFIQQCLTRPDVLDSTLRLAQRLESPDAVLFQHEAHLNQLLMKLVVGCASSPRIIRQAAHSSILSLVGLGHYFKYEATHLSWRVLRTIFQLAPNARTSSLAIMVFRNWRSFSPDKQPEPWLIQRLVSLCRQAYHDLEVYDYLFGEYKSPRGRLMQKTYQEAMAACAAQGNVELTNKYFEAYLAHYGTSGLDHFFVAPLIQVHSVNGDFQQVRIQMERNRTEFGLSPSLYDWNVLLMAYVRSPESGKAYDVFEEMKSKNVQCDSFTYGALLAVCAAQNDLEGALLLLAEARQHHVNVTIPMIDTVVSIYLARDDVKQALEIAKPASETGAKPALTRLWNSFLRYYATKGDNSGIIATRKCMAKFNVLPDGNSMLSLLVAQVVNWKELEAVAMLRSLQQRRDMTIGPLHYIVVLSGLVQAGERDWGIATATDMKRRYPDLSGIAEATVILLRDKSRGAQDKRSAATFDIEFFKILWSSTHSFSKSPNARALVQGLNGIGSFYFDSLLQRVLAMPSQTDIDDTLNELDHLITSGTQKLVPKFGMKLAIARMKAAIKHGDDQTVQNIWQSEFKRASTRVSSISERILQNEKANQDSDNQLPAQENTSSKSEPWRLSLNSLLNTYMEFMAKKSMMSAVTKFLEEDFRAAGFVVTSWNQNRYVQLLSLSRHGADRTKAFSVVEETMLNRAQNWHLLASGLFRQKGTVRYLSHFNSRNEAIKGRRNTYGAVNRGQIMRLQPERLIPTYTTMVHLAAVLLVAQSRANLGSKDLSYITHAAPRTKHFVSQMPYREDPIQNVVLQRSASTEDVATERTLSVRQFDTPTLPVTGAESSLIDEVPSDFVQDIERLVLDNQTRFKAILTADSVPPEDDVLLGEQLFGQIDRSTTDADSVCRNEDELLAKVRLLREEVRRTHLGRDYRKVDLEGPIPMIDPDASDEALDMTQSTSTPELSGTSSEMYTPLIRVLDRTQMRILPNADPEVSDPVLALNYMQRRLERQERSLRQRTEVKQQIEEAGYDNISSRALVPRSAAARRIEQFEKGRERLNKWEERPDGMNVIPSTERGVWKGLLKRVGMRPPRFVPDLDRPKNTYLVRKGLVSIQPQDVKGNDLQTPTSTSYVSYEPHIADAAENPTPPPQEFPPKYGTGHKRPSYPKKKAIYIKRASIEGRDPPLFQPYTRKKLRQLKIETALKNRDFIPHHPFLKVQESG